MGPIGGNHERKAVARTDNSGRGKLARPVWGWGRGVTSRPTPPFDRVFGRSDWAVMFILARTGRTYARLKFNVGPTAEYEIPVKRDYSQTFAGCDPERWEDEYLSHVHPQQNRRLFQSDFDQTADFDWEED